MLNRDVDNNTVDIYDIESGVKVSGEVDTRVFTEDGQNEIKEDLERINRFGQAIGDVAQRESIEITDTLKHIDDVQKDLDVQKAFALKDDGKNIDILENKENYSVEDYDKALDNYAKVYSDIYGVTIQSAKAVATQKYRGMTYSNGDGGKATNSKISIDYQNNKGAKETAEAFGHEGAHVRIDQGQTRHRETKDLQEDYAQTFEKYSADGMEFSANTYTDVKLSDNKNNANLNLSNNDKQNLRDNTNELISDVNKANSGDGVANPMQFVAPITAQVVAAKANGKSDEEIGTQINEQVEIQVSASKILDDNFIGIQGGIDAITNALNGNYTEASLAALGVVAKKVPGGNAVLDKLKNLKKGEIEELDGKSYGKNKDGDVVEIKQLEVGQVDKYKNLKKVTGDGTVDRDHIPSKEALKKRAIQIKGKKLSPDEIKRIENESQAITVKKEVHKEGSTTGGNNKALSKEDSKDLESSVQRDISERIESTKKLDPENLKKIEEGCAKIGGCTNEQYDEFLKKILRGE